MNGYYLPPGIIVVFYAFAPNLPNITTANPLFKPLEHDLVIRIGKRLLILAIARIQ